MHFAPLTKTQRADWREMLNAADHVKLAIAAVVFLFSALTLPLAHIRELAGLYLVCAVIFYYSITHSIASLLLVALPGSLLFGISSILSTPLALPACYAALLLGSLTGAFLIVNLRSVKRGLPLLALPVAAYLIAFFFTQKPIDCLLVLLPVCIAAVMAYCVLTCRPLTPSVVLIATVTAVVAASAWLISLAVTGWPDANPLVALVEEIRATFVSLYEQGLAVYEEQGILLGISDTSIENAAALLGNILPGLFCMLCLVLSFSLWRMLLRLLTAWQTLPRIPARLSGMTISAISAGLFVLTFVISLFANRDDVTLAGMVCSNLILVLEPALALAGFSALLTPGKARSCLSLLLAGGLFVLFIGYPSVGLSLAAFVGAFHILLSRFLPSSHDKGES